MAPAASYSVLEYLYRDAGNWKTHGAVLLHGVDPEAQDALRACLDWNAQFVAEQVLLPALQDRHWAEHEDEPNTLDHAFHEFVGLRSASTEEVALLADAGNLEAMLLRFSAAAGHWDVRNSRFYSAGVFLWDAC